MGATDYKTTYTINPLALAISSSTRGTIIVCAMAGITGLLPARLTENHPKAAAQSTRLGEIWEIYQHILYVCVVHAMRVRTALAHVNANSDTRAHVLR